jgi:hypothetical protein
MSHYQACIGRCSACCAVKPMQRGQAQCSRCRMRDWRARDKEVRRLETNAIHGGGIVDCGCDLCYLWRQPMTSFQTRWWTTLPAS